jgi:acylphosphatase
MNVCVKLTIQGRVQGVGFRWFTQREAERMKLQGYVKNLANGDVEVEAEGPKEHLEEFIKKLKKGPPFSRVTEALTEWKEFQNQYHSFQVQF